jgi:hypothetical protein
MHIPGDRLNKLPPKPMPPPTTTTTTTTTTGEKLEPRIRSEREK